MGILNITPDSFYDGGKFTSEKQILEATEQMLLDGAGLIDIGAVSTRPGASKVSEKEESDRLIPVLQLISRHFPEAILSVDTYRSEIAKEAIAAGGHMINDISGGDMDPNMFKTIAKLGVPYILMHMQGTPENMQNNPQYDDIIEDILGFFNTQLNKLAHLGVHNNIILDPGFGFGKTVDHNFQILKSLKRFTETGFPVLTGISRKSMINRILKTKPENALNGTTALHVIALLNGASILRVHDVKEALQAIELVEYYKMI
ncbi:MAG: dihydropteroate synthase [Bacteroidetes bacterium]|nr:dihydropteroate synthase [Bacteroidota bacterium]